MERWKAVCKDGSYAVVRKVDKAIPYEWYARDASGYGGLNDSDHSMTLRDAKERAMGCLAHLTKERPFPRYKKVKEG